MASIYGDYEKHKRELAREAEESREKAIDELSKRAVFDVCGANGDWLERCRTSEDIIRVATEICRRHQELLDEFESNEEAMKILLGEQ